MARIQKPNDDYTGDPLVPLLNLVCLLIPLLLYGAVFMRIVTIDVSTQKYDDGPPPDDTQKQPLNLTVMITDQGFHLKVSPNFRASLAPILDGSSTTADIPKKDEGWDFATLAKNLRLVKENHDTETKIFLGAEDNVPFDVIVKAMDHARGQNGSLFPNVTLVRGVV